MPERCKRGKIIARGKASPRATPWVSRATKLADSAPPENIEALIRTIRGQKVILDNDLSRVFGVPAKRLNEQVKRNLDRFPSDFMFQLTATEHDVLRSQNATLKPGRGQHRIYLPYDFTETGAI